MNFDAIKKVIPIAKFISILFFITLFSSCDKKNTEIFEVPFTSDVDTFLNSTISQGYSIDLLKNNVLTEKNDSLRLWGMLELLGNKRTDKKTVAIIDAYLELVKDKNDFSLLLYDLSKCETINSSGDYNALIKIGKKELERVKKTKHKLLIGYTLNQLSTGYFFTNDYKTAEKYILEAYEITKKPAGFYEQNRFTFYSAWYGQILRNTNRLEEAVKLFEINLEYARVLNLPRRKMFVLLNLAFASSNAKEFEKTITYLFENLETAQEEKAKGRIISTYQILADIYNSNDLYENALLFVSKAVPLLENDALLESNIVATKMACFDGLNKFDSSLVYTKRYLQLNEATKEDLINSLATAYLRCDSIEQASKCGYQHLENSYAKKDTFQIISSYQHLISLYAKTSSKDSVLKYADLASELAKAYQDSSIQFKIANSILDYYFTAKEYRNAIKYGDNCFAIAKKIPSVNDNLAFGYLYKYADCLQKEKQTEKAYQMFSLADSLNTVRLADRDKNIATLTRLSDDYFKNESIKQLHKNNQSTLEGEKKLQRQKIVTTAVVLGLLVALFFSFFIYRALKENKKAKLVIENQRNEVLEQKNIIEVKNKEIVDSINYAKNIQNALITSQDYIRNVVGAENLFIIYKPKDIISGDFYWALQKGEYFYFFVGDCTGHGVPGAFMSLLCISALNETILEKGIENTDEILNAVRLEIIHALNPSGEITSKDGMDCVLVRFHFKSNNIQFSMANNPFLIIREGKLMEFKADKMPVGHSTTLERSFAKQELTLQKMDMLYFITDGFHDQFGGEAGKKLKYRNLCNLLLQHAQNEPAEQGAALTMAFDNHSKGFEQLDDVTLVGIRI